MQHSQDEDEITENAVEDTLELQIREVEQRLPNFKLRVFRLFHEIGELDSHITKHELVRYLKKHGVYTGESTLETIVHALRKRSINSDSDMDEMWSWDQFIELMVQREHKLYSVFHEQLDVNHNGRLDVVELQKLCLSLGLECTAEDAAAMMRHADHTATDDITYPEFYSLMLNYEMLQPGIRAGHPMDTVAVMLDSLRKRSTHVVVDDGGQSFDLVVEIAQNPRYKMQYLGAAFGAALFTRTLTAPLDRVRCMLQLPVAAQQLSVAGSSGYAPDIRHAVRSAVARGGLLSLWRGNGLNVARVVPEVAARSFLFEHFKAGLASADHSVNSSSQLVFHHRFAAGMAAAVSAQMLFYPMEVLKTQASGNSSVMEAASATLKKRGVFGLYRGLCPSAIRLAADVALYEMSKYLHVQYVHPWWDPGHQLPSIPTLLALGTVSTSIAQLVTYPFLLTRTRMQVLGAPGMIATARNVVKQEGFRQLYRGVGVNFFKTVPTVALTFSAYEVMKRQLGIKTCY